MQVATLPFRTCFLLLPQDFEKAERVAYRRDHPILSGRAATQIFRCGRRRIEVREIRQSLSSNRILRRHNPDSFYVLPLNNCSSFCSTTNGSLLAWRTFVSNFGNCLDLTSAFPDCPYISRLSLLRSNQAVLPRFYHLMVRQLGETRRSASWTTSNPATDRPGWSHPDFRGRRPLWWKDSTTASSIFTLILFIIQIRDSRRWSSDATFERGSSYLWNIFRA